MRHVSFIVSSPLVMSLENSSHDMKTHTRVIKFIIYVAIGR